MSRKMMTPTNKIMIHMLLFQVLLVPTLCKTSDADIRTAHEYYGTAFKIAQQTGDFWVAEKLLQAAACLDFMNPKYFEALGDVEMKLGRPAEALLAWRRTLSLDEQFTPYYRKRRQEMKSITSSSSRWLQALEQSEGKEWECPDGVVDRQLHPNLSPLSKNVATPTYSQPLSLFASPLEIINLTAFRQHHGMDLIDHSNLIEVAFEGYREANRGGAMVDELHGELTPNNQFFEYQMSLLNEATPKELKQVMVGWKELGGLKAWQDLVVTVRQALEESSLFSQFLNQKKDNKQSESDNIECSNDNMNQKDIDGYGWISIHKDSSTHVKHAHLDARLSVVYYAQLTTSARHKIVFYDPRGLSPHQNLRFPDDLIAPPFTEVYSHYPQQGELVVFPSWLVHAVLPVDQDGAEPDGLGKNGGTAMAKTLRESLEKENDSADNYRVSISFNIGESWQGSAPATGL